MATSVLENALLLLDGRNLSGQSNVVALDFGVEPKDDTTIADGTRSNLGGLKTAGFSAEGFFDSSADADMFADVGVAGSLLTLAEGISVGDIAYNMQAVVGQYVPLQGQVGEIAGFSIDAGARGDLQRGSILFHSTSEAASDTGTGLQAGAAAASITAILHVFSASGSSPTLDVDIESDSDNTFASATTQASFTQATAEGVERVVATGAVTDTWWRVNFTIGGAGADFGFAVILIVE